MAGAQPAYQRLIGCPQLSRRQRRELRDRYESLDPVALKRKAERRLKPMLAVAQTRSRPQGVHLPGS